MCPTLRVWSQCYPDLGRVFMDYPGKGELPQCAANLIPQESDAMVSYISREVHAGERKPEREAGPRCWVSGSQGLT